MADPAAGGVRGVGETTQVNDLMNNPKKRRNSIFSGVRDLNTTAYPDRHYKNHLLDEVRKWKWLAQNALELSISVPNNNLSNVSTIQDSSIVTKMKSFIDEKPDLEEFMTANSKFIDRAAQHCKKIGEIHGRINTFSIEKDKLVLEISRDVREQILLDC